MKIKIKEIIGVLDKLIILHSSDPNVQNRWNNRKEIKSLVDVSEYYNEQLEEIKNRRNTELEKLKKKYGVDKIEKEMKEETEEEQSNINYPIKYLSQIEVLNLTTNDEIKILNETEVDISDKLPKLKIKDVVKIAKKRNIDIWSNDFLKLENFIED